MRMHVLASWSHSVEFVSRDFVRSVFVIAVSALACGGSPYALAAASDRPQVETKTPAATTAGKKAPATATHGETAAKTIPKNTGKTRKQRAVRPLPEAKGRNDRGRRLKRIESIPTAQSRKLTSAFIVSAELRPMAQQLSLTRSPAAYAGVLAYAESHTGEAASAAYLALGHAYQSSHRYSEAFTAYREAAQKGEALDDYADYLAAQSAMQSGNGSNGSALLEGFATKYPKSIFTPTVPLLLVDIYLQQNNPQAALQVLNAMSESAQASHADYLFALARANQLSGNTQQAAAAFRLVYLQLPVSPEAAQSRRQLQQMGAGLTAADSKAHADLLFNAKRYGEASDEYHAIEKSNASLSAADRNALQIYAAVCDLKLNRLSRRDAERLPNTADDSGALKLYIQAEILRNENNTADHRAILTQMVQRFPKSRWLEEALYSGGNMYLLKHDATQAIWHYSQLYQSFPNSAYAPSAHWRAAWLNYRIRNYPESARLMEEQIQSFPKSQETPSALYWRARIYEDQEHNFPQAVNFYKTLSETYRNYYYSLLAKQRLSVLKGQPETTPSAVLGAVRAPDPPELIEDLPENDIHLIKARLLANASLNEFIAPEIQASPTSALWGTLAQAEIYASYGENIRSLQAMKRSGLSFFALAIDDVPSRYWHLLFPRPYWSDITSSSQRNGVDPYLVASLIRQESEFNPGAVSYANAYGLMQLLPSTAKVLAKKQGVKGFTAATLLNPTINIQLGTTNLKQVLDRFGGQVEYALAAYNAGDSAVRQWKATNDYRDMPEFVESIPFTQTREYVQAILRNREMYRAIYAKQ
jgi:soluble lytic murein transglycosylase